MADFRRYDYRTPARQDIRDQGYIRVPKFLIESHFPPEWTTLDLKVFVWLISKMNPTDPWAIHYIPVSQARKWLGATRPELAKLWQRLREFPIPLIHTTVTVLERCWLEQVNVLTRGMAIDQTDMSWQFSQRLISLMNEGDYYGRVHLEVVKQLDSRASIQLYMLGSLYQQLARTNVGGGFDQDGRQVSLVYKAFAWTPGQLKDWLGAKPSMRLGNFKDRVIEVAIKKIKATGAFDHSLTKALYEKNRGRGSGRAHDITLIRFRFEGESWVPRDWKGIFAKAKNTEAEAHWEVELEKKRLEEQAIHDAELKRLRREAWEQKKELAAAAWNKETLQ
jgi:hypothetical protein